MAKKMPDTRPNRGMSRKELNENAKKVGGSSARYIGKRGSFTGT